MPDPTPTLPHVPAGEETTARLPADPVATQTWAASGVPDGGSAGTAGRRFGDYELLAEIARGGMGVVYRARQLSANRLVALKLIRSGTLASSDDVRRFNVEAQAAANLEHANVLPIYQVGQHDGQPFFSMKLVEGGNLSARVTDLVARPRESAELVARLARAVHFAHQRGILHRDIKPANVLLDADGTPYVADFGLAKQIEGDSSLTQSGAIVGTPSYMPPEQARADRQITTAADVYALGAILYELISGRPPFRAATTIGTIREVLEKEPEHPRAHHRQADRDLSAIALKCLQKAPEARYESAAALADDLERWLSGESTRARPPSLAGQVGRWLKRNATAAIGIAVLGLVTGLAASLIPFARTAENPREDYFLYPPDMSLLNPLRWVQLIRYDPVVHSAHQATCAVLVLGMGWLIWLAARPRSTRTALGAAAVVGLLATLVAFPIIAPDYQMQYENPGRGLHPVTDPLYPDVARQPGELYSPADAEYLERTYPSGRRPNASSGVPMSTVGLYRMAVSANRFHSAVTLGWSLLIVILVLTTGLAVHSTWAADHLVRSGRGVLACGLCYLELYPPVALLLTVCVQVAWLSLFYQADHSTSVPVSMTLAAAFVVLAHFGVVRRWHPALRFAGYAVVIAIAAGLLIAFGE
jgi:hypothetical protein